MNANIKLTNVKTNKFGERVGNIIVKSSKLKPINFPKKEVVSTLDEIPILMTIASLIPAISTFNHIGIIRGKESDRIKNMEIGLNKIGIKTKSTNDSLEIYGNPNIKFKKKLDIFSNDDHRIAMSWAIFGLLTGGNVEIHNFDTVNTSFPNFLSLIKSIGGKIEIK